MLEDKLKSIAEQLKNGIAPPKETVRTLLSWQGVSRRGWRVSRRIKWRLEQHGLRTEPDFEYAYIDGYISFQKAPPKEVLAKESAIDPTHRIARLTSANRAPLCVKPDSTLQQTVTLMLTNDYSQLPVMTSTREVKGIVSWKTIGSRLALKRPCTTAQDCLEPAHEVGVGDSLFSAIRVVVERDYVLVRADDKQICGIITATDLTEQFQKLAEPFLLVGEIENGVRRLLHGRFTKEELDAAKLGEDKERKVDGVADLTFGEYVRLLEPEKNWSKVRLEIDRVEFVKRLHEIREIRNDVMHFDPDGLDEGDLRNLREFAQFLKRLRDVGAA
jgi:predicted transcriptional regulator